MTFKKGIVCGFVLSAVMVMGAVPYNAAVAKPDGFSTHSDVIYKRLTRSQCLKKKGYLWDSKNKRCVKDDRGSH